LIEKLMLSQDFFFGKSARKIPDLGTGIRIPWLTENGPLVKGGEKSVPIVARATLVGWRIDHDETWKILILGPQAIADPGSHRGANEVGRSGMEK
jgi:hypothetical protein